MSQSPVYQKSISSRTGATARMGRLHSLNVIDIHNVGGNAAVISKGQLPVRQALDTLRRTLPFRLRGIDSDNGGEFINQPLYRYCQAQQIQFTRGRPYKKDDNAHIEQKNWTHVRKLVGYDRYDSRAALEALNTLYADLRLWQNLWLPSVKLVKKTRVGSRLRREYGPPQTPFARLQACPGRPDEARRVGAAARAPGSLCPGRAHRPAAGPPLRLGQPSPECRAEEACGRCRSCGKRTERVSHKLLGKPNERVFHTAHRPSFSR